MITKDTLPDATGSPLNHKYLDLSDEEKERLKYLLEELRIMFNADNVTLVQTEVSISKYNCYKIEIINSPMGMIL